MEVVTLHFFMPFLGISFSYFFSALAYPAFVGNAFFSAFSSFLVSLPLNKNAGLVAMVDSGGVDVGVYVMGNLGFVKCYVKGVANVCMY